MLPWPPYSPDLSPIEHVWDIIGRRLHALPQPRSEDELWQMVEKEWRAIPQDAIRTLIDSLPRRVAACIAVRGGPTCYIQMVRRWRSWFLEGRRNVHDDERSGRPVTATDNAAVDAVRNVVGADRRVTIDEIMIRLPPGIEIGRSSIRTIMSDVLNFGKVCAR
ncbi:Transposase [Cordylochernes scorpioides]|uniref:Transposase n=1 Tax=Cordylochernes scorpioides TaxID=51811 RepID=A0ABY6LXC0_9ARAC|nr:Transposase [Cordylochernes scorpioides]